MVNLDTTQIHPSENGISNNQRKLSRRELEVLLLIAFENTNAEIGKKLFLSKGTIATYRNILLSKLSVKNTAGLVRVAVEKEILVLNDFNKIQLNQKYDM